MSEQDIKKIEKENDGLREKVKTLEETVMVRKRNLSKLLPRA